MDLLIYETGGGGDLKLAGNDLAKVMGVENGPYLAMFGGNGHWADYMDPDNPFNSKTEDVLKVTPLTSAGRVAVQRAVEYDMQYLSATPGTTWSVSVRISSNNKWIIGITINGQLFEREFNPA